MRDGPWELKKRKLQFATPTNSLMCKLLEYHPKNIALQNYCSTPVLSTFGNLQSSCTA